MANNRSIQILRGSKTYDPIASEQVLLDGQPFYSKKNGKFYVGDNVKKIKELDDVAALNLSRETGSVNQKSFTYNGEELYDGENVQLKNGEVVEGAISIGYQSAAFGGLKYDVASYNYVKIGEKYYDIVSLHPVKIQYKKGDIISSDASGNITIDGIVYKASSNYETQEVTFLNTSNGQSLTSVVKDARTPTSAEGHQSFAAGGSTHAYGDWSISIGKDNKSYQRASVSMGGGNKSGLSEQQFNFIFTDRDSEGNIIDNFTGSSYLNSFSFCTSMGESNDVMGRSSTATGLKNTIYGWSRYSFAAGSNNKIGYDRQGNPVQDKSAYSMSAFGDNNKICGPYSSVFGNENSVEGQSSIAYGWNNKIFDSSRNSIVGGSSNELSSSGESIICGTSNSVCGYNNIVVGNNNESIGISNTIFFGSNNEAGDTGNSSIIGGMNNKNSGIGSIVVGDNNENNGRFNVVQGYNNNLVEGEMAIVVGASNYLGKSGTASTLKGSYSIVGGLSNQAKGESDLLIGNTNESFGKNNIVCGYSNHIIDSESSITFGTKNYNYSSHSIVGGIANKNYGMANIVVGDNNNVFGNNGIVIGKGNEKTSAAECAAAIGYSNKVKHNYSTAIGVGLQTAGDFQIVMGRYNNIIVDNISGGYDPSQQLFVFGCGTYSADGSGNTNALSINTNGELRLYKNNTVASDYTALNFAALKSLFKTSPNQQGKFTIGSITISDGMPGIPTESILSYSKLTTTTVTAANLIIQTSNNEQNASISIDGTIQTKSDIIAPNGKVSCSAMQASGNASCATLTVAGKTLSFA